MRRKDLEIPSNNDPLASLPREAVDDDNSLLTVVSILNASLFGAPIHETKASLDHIEVAVHQDDSSGVPNTKQPKPSWHRVQVPQLASCDW